MANRNGAPGSANDDAKYRMIAADLRELIAGLRAAARLPTEAELAAEYTTTRVTVRKAYDLLINEALVVKRGKGYFVRGIETTDWTLSIGGQFVDHWQHKVDALAAAKSKISPAQSTNVRIEPAAKHLRGVALADLLADPGELVVCRSSLRYLTGGPVEACDIYAPYDLVKDTPFMEQSPRSIPDLLASFDQTVTDFADDCAARPPDPAETERLELPAATWVVDLSRRVHGAGGRCVLVQHSVFNALGASFRHASRA